MGINQTTRAAEENVAKFKMVIFKDVKSGYEIFKFKVNM